MSRTSTLLSFVIFSVVLLLVSPTQAKDKNKALMQADVLRAQTVYVAIAPEAGETLIDPNANRRAQEDVEKALMDWGRFRMAMEPESADLLIQVRKGSGKITSPTMAGGPIDQRPVIIQPTDDGIRVGGRQGQNPNQPPGGPQDSGPHVQNEMGPSEDMFEVYRGAGTRDSPPVWRYVAKDALRSPTVPAVEQFRKALEDAEKAANEKAAAKKKQP